ncbi:MAG: acetate kinase, partial [Bryobacteraceae bacterium]
MKILSLNAGSSSFKCRLDDLSRAPLPLDPPKPVWEDRFDLDPAKLDEALRSIPGPVEVVGHRIVHGGKFRESIVITNEVRAAIAREAEIAPSHNRGELAAVDAVERVFGDRVKQIAVFDTEFHATLAPQAFVYPGPY